MFSSTDFSIFQTNTSKKSQSAIKKTTRNPTGAATTRSCCALARRALQGFEMDIEHLDGHKVHVSREKITWPGARIRKQGEGMPNYENNNLFGTLYITFDVAFPKGQLNDKDKKLISETLKQDPISAAYNGLGGFKASS